ncbi:putative Ig domain-containing protein [Glycomyces sp. NPDC048151]
MPEGLVLDALTGVVSGAAVETGSYDVTFGATNGNGTVQHTATITVA